MCTVAGAEPAVVVTSTGDGHAAKVGAHTNHNKVLQDRRGSRSQHSAEHVSGYPQVLIRWAHERAAGREALLSSHLPCHTVPNTAAVANTNYARRLADSCCHAP